MAVAAHPPMQSKYAHAGPSDYEIQLQREAERREKARLRMARKRAELKQRPLEEQERACDATRFAGLHGGVEAA
ncbi:hypothetical protein C8R43DRAFT_1127200 [Mycena crocata]|nr:hypothetical protein C8R43DRAFT_1127200 [Mycena crocata]